MPRLPLPFTVVAFALCAVVRCFGQPAQTEDTWYLDESSVTRTPMGYGNSHAQYKISVSKVSSAPFTSTGTIVNKWTVPTMDGMTAIATIPDITGTLNGAVDGQQIKFTEEASPAQGKIVMTIAGGATIERPLQCGGGKLDSSLPLKDGASVVLQLPRPAGVTASVTYTLQKKKIHADVLAAMFPIKQEKQNDCWLASLTMLMAWKGKKPLDVWQVLDQAGPEYTKAYKKDRALGVDAIKQLCTRFNLYTESAPVFAPEDIETMLKTTGPIEFTVYPPGNNGTNVNHAVDVVTIDGDGTDDGTTVTFIDPADGVTHDEKYSQFKIDAGVGADYGFNAVHF